MELRELCRGLVRGGLDLVRLAARGELSREQVWVAAEGARKYVEATARGDVAPAAAMAERRVECAGCDARVHAEGLALGYCGRPFVVVTVAGRESCGCLLDGAIRVASHACPRRRYEACEPRKPHPPRSGSVWVGVGQGTT